MKYNDPVGYYSNQEAGRAFEVKKELESLMGKVELDTLSIGELLYEVKSNNYFINFGLESFKEYTNTLPFKYSKTRYLVKIIEVMKFLNIPKKDYEKAGIAKLREITSLDPNSYYINPETSEEKPMSEYIIGLIEVAPEKELNEIKEAVRKLKGIKSEDEFVWLNISVKKDVRDLTIIPALEKARMEIGSTGQDLAGNYIDASDGACLELLAVEFLNQEK